MQRDRAVLRLEQALKNHGGGIPVDHRDVKMLEEAKVARQAFRNVIQRHSREAEHPTCAVCDGPATIFDEGRDAMVCLDHIVPWSRI